MPPVSDATPHADGWVVVPGGRLRYELAGDGPPVVLLHAGVVDRRAWEPVIPYLVAGGFRVIWYDARGFGESTTDDVTFSNRADLVALLDELAIGRAALVGNSRGGTIAIDTAIEFPDRVVALVTVGGGISGFDSASTDEETALFDRIEAAETAHDPDAIVELEVRAWLDGPTAPPGRVGEPLRSLFIEMDRAICDPTRVFGRPIPLDPPADGRLGSLAVPVLAVAGALDESATLAAAERLETAVPGARRVGLPDVAHLIGMEAPERLASLVIDHLRPLAPRA